MMNMFAVTVSSNVIYQQKRIQNQNDQINAADSVRSEVVFQNEIKSDLDVQWQNVINQMLKFQA